MVREKKHPAEIRREAGRMARSWAEERQRCGDEEGASELLDLARSIERIRLTRDVR